MLSADNEGIEMSEMTPQQIRDKLAEIDEQQAAYRKSQIIGSAKAAREWVDTIDAPLDLETTYELQKLCSALGHKIQEFYPK